MQRIFEHYGAAFAMVTADRGYWDATIDTDLDTAGLPTVATPRTGKPSIARQHAKRGDVFVTTVK